MPVQERSSKWRHIREITADTELGSVSKATAKKLAYPGHALQNKHRKPHGRRV